MRYLISAFLILAVMVAVYGAETARHNNLKEMCGGPYYDLPPVSKAAASNFGGQLLKGCGLANGIWKDKGRFQYAVEPVLLESLMPLKTGNGSERKVFQAALTVCKAFAYATDNYIDKGEWNDKKLNKLLRLDGKPNDPDKISDGACQLAMDFLEISCAADPSNKNDLDKKP
jgi:hypothetical protein